MSQSIDWIVDTAANGQIMRGETLEDDLEYIQGYLSRRIHIDSLHDKLCRSSELYDPAS